jgi:uncharacterized protein (TIGR03067 family)
MGRSILGLAWFASITLATAADEPKAEVKKDAAGKAMEMFAGTWEIAHVKPNGATNDARRLVFNRDGSYAAQDTDGNELWAGTFEIDPTANPKVWDHRSNEAKKEGKDALGIYDLDGDRLTLACVVGQWKDKEWVGKPRPKAIDLKKADVVLELKRIEPAKFLRLLPRQGRAR